MTRSHSELKIPRELGIEEVGVYVDEARRGIGAPKITAPKVRIAQQQAPSGVDIPQRRQVQFLPQVLFAAGKRGKRAHDDVIGHVQAVLQVKNVPPGHDLKVRGRRSGQLKVQVL